MIGRIHSFSDIHSKQRAGGKPCSSLGLSLTLSVTAASKRGRNDEEALNNENALSKKIKLFSIDYENVISVPAFMESFPNENALLSTFEVDTPDILEEENLAVLRENGIFDIYSNELCDKLGIVLSPALAAGMDHARFLHLLLHPTIGSLVS